MRHNHDFVFRFKTQVEGFSVGRFVSQPHYHLMDKDRTIFVNWFAFEKNSVRKSWACLKAIFHFHFSKEQISGLPFL